MTSPPYHSSPEKSTDAGSCSNVRITNINIVHDRASDLLMAVSVLADDNKAKITKLARSAMEELIKLALEGPPLWLPHQDQYGKFTYDTLNEAEYTQRFGHLDDTLMEVIKMIEAMGDQPPSQSNNTLDPFRLFDNNTNNNRVFSKDRIFGNGFPQREASREVRIVRMKAIEVVELLMDLKKWPEVFFNIVSRALVIGLLSTRGGAVQGNYDETLQVMSAEFHMATPLLPARESYYTRYCKRLSYETWGVVDVSLDELFPSPTTNFRRRPSGCLIQEMPNGCSKVIWVEHVEADHTGLHKDFKQLVSSDLAFGAKVWVASIIRHCEWYKTLMARSTPTDDGVLLPQAGRGSMLKLADRMMRTFCVDMSASKGNSWMQLPIFGGEDMRVVAKNIVDDPGKPPCPTIIFATTFWLPASPIRLFNFLRDENLRDKWDILSRGHAIRELAYVINGEHKGNRVSIMQVNAAPTKISVLYLQRSHTDSTASYVIYAPLDIFASSTLLNGGNPDCIAILPSGFAIFPDGSSNGQDSGGSLLTIGFHIVDHKLSTKPTCNIPVESIHTIHKVISETVGSIKANVVYNNNTLESWILEDQANMKF